MHFLFWTKGSHQIPNFDTLKCSGENLPNSPCHFSNHESVFHQILHHSSVSCKINPLHFFRSNVICFTQKKPIKVQILETSDCSCQNSPNSCDFWNSESVFLQILHHTSVSWDVTSLYFFADILYTFNKRNL